MKILVIPDVHLKPHMFDRAQALLRAGRADRAVCLMDLPDDWRAEFHLDLYAQTFDRAIAFASDFPDTLWCWGNHDLCYPWNERESGYSPAAAYLVREKLRSLEEAVPDGNLAVVHRLDDVLFVHGGLADRFVRRHVPAREYDDPEAVLRCVNSLGAEALWTDDSPIWHRPQYSAGPLWMSDTFLQVAGHTPVNRVYFSGGVLSCDVFSTQPDGAPIGDCRYPVIDTATREWACF